ncbi:hypothetical protein NHH73_24865 [Oxalobacteraceae bacterium OTU3CINTB1]|nr:hypothetical protein NHH73_24865 [Oxalobacteraceae bacterium OTU3CINTB1]
MNPLALNPFVLLGAGAAALAIGFGAGWQVQGWRGAAELSGVKLNNAEAITQASAVALSDYKLAATVIKDAAGTAQVDITALGVKLDTINRKIKNAPPPSLPADCKPGPARLRNLAEAAAAADAAAARPVPGK